MSVVKNKMIEHEIEMEDFRAGLRHMEMWGRKSFQDHTGEWVEVLCSKQANLFDDTLEAIPHVIERS